MSPRPPDDGDVEPLDDLLRPLDGGSGPARRLSRQRSSALVQAALDAALQQAPEPPRRSRRRPPVWLMAGAALIFTGAAAAAVWRYARPEQPPPAVLTPAVPEPTRVATLEPVPLPPPPPPEPFVIEHPRPLRPSITVKESSKPEDLLRQANALRSEGRWKEAEGLYLRVIRAEPSSLAAYVARVASGALRLEHLGDARGALRQFQDAVRLHPGGMLAPEARHGVAEAHRALGDSTAEARALEEFLALHPDSPLSAASRARLRELSPP
ncbi:tol-pal system YbgF family protein [Corallococcus sp. RDP092CA]|uniref:tol-pal system YbgF family protein n=1 Tax=Corallococcus sp. RDP092CA TaxID=3109369 RepID=UPI0035B2190A